MEKRWNSETVPLVRSKDNKRLNRRQITLLLLVLTGIMLVLVLGIAGFTCLIVLNPVQSSSTDPYTRNYQHAAIATDAAPCSSIGADLLMKGGTAVDSAVGSMLCVGVVNLHSTGLGGGGFMLYYNATTEEMFALDFREKAPGYIPESTMAKYINDSLSTVIGKKVFI